MARQSRSLYAKLGQEGHDQAFLIQNLQYFESWNLFIFNDRFDIGQLIQPRPLTNMANFILVLVLAALLSIVRAIPTISITGSKFFTSEGKQFYVKGSWLTDNYKISANSKKELPINLSKTIPWSILLNAREMQLSCLNSVPTRFVYTMLMLRPIILVVWMLLLSEVFISGLISTRSRPISDLWDFWHCTWYKAYQS